MNTAIIWILVGIGIALWCTYLQIRINDNLIKIMEGVVEELHVTKSLVRSLGDKVDQVYENIKITDGVTVGNMEIDKEE